MQKPVIFLTCRIHCGETPGQYMLQGIIDKLMDFDDLQTQVLLRNYVFKIIPNLNPDGVARGMWRFDTQGINLNRYYENPKDEKHPTVIAAKKEVLKVHDSGRLKMYMDFHAHCSKRGCFIYGNQNSDPSKLAEAKLIPKLMSMNCVNFDFRGSVFNDTKNNSEDWQGESRIGRGRSVIGRETE